MAGPSRILRMCGLVVLPGLATAQCPSPTWLYRFTTPATGLATAAGLVSRAACFQVFDPDGPGPEPEELYVGGEFHSADGIVSPMIAKWNGQAWSNVAGGLAGAPGSRVTALGLHDPDGSGPARPVLVAAGKFTTAGGVAAPNIAAWNGTDWTALGVPPDWNTWASVVGGPVGIADIDFDGPGPMPYQLAVATGGIEASSSFRAVALWDGQTWTLSPEGGPGQALAMAVFDEDGAGPEPESVYLGTSDAPGIYRWNGTGWNVVGGGLGRSMPWMCTALRVVDEDGTGPARPVLLAGGSFSSAGGTPALSIARWNGITWSAMGSGAGDGIGDIVAVENPGQPQRPFIYAVGGIQVARWDPLLQTWSPMGTLVTAYPFPPCPRMAAYRGTDMRDSIYIGGHYSVIGIPSAGMSQLACLNCYANCDGSTGTPLLTANDFMCFFNHFVTGNMYANCDNSSGTPILTANDFVCFIVAYAAGCS